MTTTNQFKGINNVRQFVSNSNRASIPCEINNCSFNAADQELDTVINHYIEHGFEILHIGTETEMRDGKLHFYTIVLFGSR
ncbi:MAG: hypothetical protein HY761_10630 [Candidatus Omnitrophica bacterium]|nr:hypothetical protein [Candidatus Omnitrophota bacterium]